MLSGADKATLAVLYRSFVPASAPVEGAGAMAIAIERLPASKVAELRRFLALLRTPVLSLVLAGKPRAFAALSPQGREDVLLAMAHSPVPQIRTAYQAVKRLALFIAYSYSDGIRNALWERIGYPGPRTDLPEQTYELPLTGLGELCPAYDVIVVGSGAGGGVAAGLCAQAGLSVLVLEAGPAPAQTARLQREFDAFANLYLDAGLTGTEDLSVGILAGSCVGGGTSINWSTSLQLDQSVARQWDRSAGGIDFAESLQPHYAAVGQRLELVPATAHNENNDALRRGAQGLNWRGIAQPRNASQCAAGCGYCGFGCAYDHKKSTPRTYLRDAVERGAHVVAGAIAQHVYLDAGGRAHGVSVLFNADGDVKRRTIAAKHVILAAGALRTPGLLAASGIKNAHTGNHLRLHPTTAIFAEFAHDVEPWRGPMQSYLIDEFSDIDDAYGFKLEAVPAHPGLAALALPWCGARAHEEQMLGARKHAGLIALVRDRGEGRVATGGVPKISYSLGRYDARHLRLGIRKLAQAALAAGALSVRTLHARPLTLQADGSFPDFETQTKRASVAPNRIGLFSAHQMGTARMHRDPAQGVVDANGRVHGHANLLVADASVFPLASGVNPMLTIMALSHRTVSRFLGGG